MKSGQLILVLVLLAGLVFAFTFIPQYLSTTSPPKPSVDKDKSSDKSTPNVSNGRLIFSSVRYPQQPNIGQESELRAPVEAEFHQTGFREFWFENPTDEPIRVGVDSKNCTCYKVDLCIAPEEWKYQLASVGEGPRLAKEQGLIPTLVSATIGRKKREELGQEAANKNLFKPLLKENEEGIVVPPKAFGLVRLTWDGRRDESQGSQRPLLISATLWFHAKGSGIGQTLQIRTLLMDPVQVDIVKKEIGAIGEKQERKVYFRVWSATRENFDIKIKAPGRLVEGGELEPLTEADRRELAESCAGCRILSGYRVPIIIRERSSDEKVRFDQGPFDRIILLTAEETKAKEKDPEVLATLEVVVSGEIKGNFKISHSSGEGRIDLGSFSAMNGAATEAVISTELEDKELELQSYPKLLQVKLEKSKATLGGVSGQWTLYVVVPRNTLSGAFRDTIILKVKDSTGQLIRVPVIWRATR